MSRTAFRRTQEGNPMEDEEARDAVRGVVGEAAQALERGDQQWPGRCTEKAAEQEVGALR